MILLHPIIPIIEIAAGSMPHVPAQFGADRSGVAVVAIGRDPGRGDATHRLGGAEERLGGGPIAGFAQPHIDQGTGAVDRAVELNPAPLDLQVSFVNVPAAAHLAASPPTQGLSQGWGELGLPVSHGLIAEPEATDQDHLTQIPQAQLVTQPPEHHESDDVGGVLGPVQHRARALVPLLATRAAAEPAVALGGTLRPLRNSGLAAPHAPHPLPPPLSEAAL